MPEKDRFEKSLGARVVCFLSSMSRTDKATPEEINDRIVQSRWLNVCDRTMVCQAFKR